MRSLFLALSFLLGVQSSLAAVFECEMDKLPYPGWCYLRDLNTSRTQEDYGVTGDPSEVNNVLVDYSKVGFLSRVFCDTFPNIRQHALEGQGVEVLDSKAYEKCGNLENVRLRNNLIEVVPDDLFRNNLKLLWVEFSNNKIGYLPSRLFANSKNLYFLEIKNNQITTLPTSFFDGLRNLRTFNAEGNNIIELDAARMREHLVELSRLDLNNNLIPCSQVPILRSYLGRVLFGTSQVGSKPFRMRIVDEVACVDGN